MQSSPGAFTMACRPGSSSGQLGSWVCPHQAGVKHDVIMMSMKIPQKAETLSKDELSISKFHSFFFVKLDDETSWKHSRHGHGQVSASGWGCSAELGSEVGCCRDPLANNKYSSTSSCVIHHLTLCTGLHWDIYIIY